MPIYTIQGPDGKTYEIEGPEGATADQLGAFVSSQGGDSVMAPRQGNAQGASLLNRIGMGASDPVAGTAQLLARAPTSFLNAVNASGDPANAEFTQESAPAMQQNVDRAIQEREQQYQADRSAAGQGGIDGGRLVGNIASTVPLAMMVPGAAAPGLMARTASSTASGMLAGASSPVTEGNFADEKYRQLMMSGALGAAAPGVAQAAGRVISPQTNQSVRTLMQEGVTPSPGQILGGNFARAEEKLMSVPLLGDTIRNSRVRASDDFNRAAYARALKKIDQAPSGAVGREGVQEVKDALGTAYNSLLPRLTFKADNAFSQEINQLQTMMRNGALPEDVPARFDAILKNDVFSRMTKNGTMDGEAFKQVESSLGQKVKQYMGSPNPADRELGAALSEVLSSARGGLNRSNPMYSGQLQKINEGYANYTRIRDAAGRQGAEDGVFSPAQLSAAIRAGDKSAGKGNYATGNALMQDLSDAGRDVLGSKIPNSGTADRMMMGAIPLGALATVSPYAALGAGASMLPYTQTGQRAAAALLTKRPVGAEALAQGLRRTAPGVGVGSAPLLQSRD